MEFVSRCSGSHWRLLGKGGGVTLSDSCFKRIPLAVGWVLELESFRQLTWKRQVRTRCMRKQSELGCDLETEPTGLLI